ncbi:MAG: hypothetical protein R2932_09035 [Caldilineaceae bacterium]
MRKLSWLLSAVALAFYTVHLWSTADPTATYMVRDGVIFALAAVLLFAAHTNRTINRIASPLLSPQLRAVPTKAGHVILWTGAICALVGGLLRVAGPSTFMTSSGTMLWSLGLLLLAIAVLWPSVWRFERQVPQESTTEEAPGAGDLEPIHAVFPLPMGAAHPAHLDWCRSSFLLFEPFAGLLYWFGMRSRIDAGKHHSHPRAGSAVATAALSPDRR